MCVLDSFNTRNAKVIGEKVEIFSCLGMLSTNFTKMLQACINLIN